MDNLFARADKTVCAVSTPSGHGGVAMIRVSGNDAVQIVRRIAAFLPQNPESHRVYYGFLLHPKTQKKIDEVLISYFAKGRSFTNEEVCEISCHGNPLICDEILQSLVFSGAVIADRGEFTFRAFMNGRLDLTQAESVLSLIESQSRSAKALALRQLEGHLGDQIDQIESSLIRLMAHIEADIDFSTENLETISRPEAAKKLEDILRRISLFLQQYEQGRLLRDGIQVSFFGLPNVGKSSLFNKLIEKEQAIVTDIPGTTRDVLEGATTYKGVRIHFFDTAGVRSNANDAVEKIGIERTHQANKRADLSLFVTEATRSMTPEEQNYFQQSTAKKQILVLNKIDLLSADQKIDKHHAHLAVSTFMPETREKVLDAILESVGIDLQTEDVAVLSQSRHYDLLLQAQTHLDEANRLILDGLGLELIALELKSALFKVQEILGKHYDDQILDQIFKEFCLGK